MSFKRLLALGALVRALVREPRWWNQVDDIRRGARAQDIAATYRSGDRRVVIARMLQAAASAPDAKRGHVRMLALGTVAQFAGPLEGRGPYRYRPEHGLTIDEGALAAVRRGAGRCLACAVELAGVTTSAHGRRVRRDYCSRHDGDPLTRRRLKSIDRI